MSEALEPPDSRPRQPDSVRGGGRREQPHYAALDLGTNNCRLLIAAPTARGFRIVDAYSRIVRLGEGLTGAGRLQEPAMERAMAALRVCADRVKRRNVLKVRAIATQACRMAENGADFVERVREETGLELEIISPKQEAQLSVAGCLNLFDRNGAQAALVVDVGGGSTELSWVDLTDGKLDQHVRRFAPQRLPIRAWLSIPVGVVTLAENFPETETGAAAWFRAMVDHVKQRMDGFRHADSMRRHFDGVSAHMVGTSGAITSLAGLHLGLRRYERAAVDGLWMTEPECRGLVKRIGLCAAFAMNVMLFSLPTYFGMDRNFEWAGLFGLLSLIFGTLTWSGCSSTHRTARATSAGIKGCDTFMLRLGWTSHRSCSSVSTSPG